MATTTTVFSNIPKVSLTHGVTAIEKMSRVSELFPSYNLFIKRDDCTGLALGGNKSRKLEYLMADAIAQGADTIITCGGIQSNHARQTAAAAAKLGLTCHLVLEPVAGTPANHYADSGNMLLNHLFGAHCHQVKANDSCVDTMSNLAIQLKKEGKKTYSVPLGGSNVIGSLGYVNCGLELAKQISEQALNIDCIVLATGSGGTQAGLLAGLALAGVDIPVLGICVSRSGFEQEELVNELLQKLLQFIDIPNQVAREKVKANGDFYGAGYGIASQAMIDAVTSIANLEGILLDPVYTGKAMAGLLSLAKNNKLIGKNILFLHTGGSPGLFAYQDVF